MHHYVEISDMLAKAIKAERRLKRRGQLRSTSSPSPSYSRTPQVRHYERATTSNTPFSKPRPNSSKRKVKPIAKTSNETLTPRKRILSVGGAKGLNTLQVNVLTKGQCLYFRVAKL